MNRRKNKFSDNEAVNLYLKGLSLAEVAKLAGVCSAAIDKVLKKHNVLKRSISEAIKTKIQNGTHKTPWKPMEQHIGWRGGRIDSKGTKGYVRIKMPEHPRANKKGYILEHITVWEKANGRMLELGEVVHHLNGIKNDNRHENLVALPERVHASISGKQGAKVPKMRDFLQLRIRELEAQLAKGAV